MAKQAREILAGLTRSDNDGFPGLLCKTSEGQSFALSVQGSRTHYCKPRAELAKLTDYESVEIGMWGEGNSPVIAVARPQCPEWLQPSDVGFIHVKNNLRDNVVGWVPVADLVADLDAFLLCGGTIEL